MGIKNLNRRKIDEIAQVHPACYYFLLYNNYTDIVYEHLINGVGKIDFIAKNNNDDTIVFECKNNLYNPMALNKAAAQCYTYIRATKAKSGILVAPIDTVYADAYYDITQIFRECDIYILELPILEKATFENKKNMTKKIVKPQNIAEEKLVVDKDLEVE